MNPSWTEREYAAILDEIEDRRVPVISLEEYGNGCPGVWLRHDVEICLESAVAMARSERERAIAATYFICFDSPIIGAALDRFRDAVGALVELGHRIGVHLMYDGDRKSVARRHEALSNVFSDLILSVTYHAPGRAARDLAGLPGGSAVYQLMADGRGRYASDSAGRWSWGEVDLREHQGESIQLLTHPYWWFGRELQVSNAAVSTFLPRYHRESNLDT
jgi:hypothetical protein